MKAALDAFESQLDSPLIGNISVDEFDSRRQVVGITAREIIGHPHPVTLVQQCVYQMRTHEPGTTGHEKASHPRLLNMFHTSDVNRSEFNSALLLLRIVCSLWKHRLASQIPEIRPQFRNEHSQDRRSSTPFPVAMHNRVSVAWKAELRL